MATEFTKRQKIGISLLVALAVILFVLIMLWVLSDDESASECIRPSNTTGYNNITETNLSMGSEFDVSVDCASGYTGTASATACSVAGQAYTLTGCSADSTAGASSGSTSGGDCTTPNPVPTGYDLSNVTGSLSKASFSITGVRCASVYGGTPSATACSVAGQAYTLTGCPVAESGSSVVGSSSTNSCSLANVVAPNDGTLGTICADTSGSLAHGASCDMTCNDRNVPTNQPQCNNGVLSSITATCGSVVPDPEPEPAPAPTCSDINGDGTTDDPFDCSGQELDLRENPSNEGCPISVVDDPNSYQCDAETCCTRERPEPCSLSNIHKPGNVNWGTICSEENISNELTIPDGVSCDFTCAPSGGSSLIPVANPTEHCQAWIDDLQRVFGVDAGEVLTMEQCLGQHTAETGSSEELILKNQPQCRDGVFITGTSPNCFGANEHLCVQTLDNHVRWVTC